MAKWKDQIQRALTGPRHELESLPGYWIVPRKFGMGAQQEIRALQVQMALDSPAFVEACAGEDVEDMSFERIIETVDPATRARITVQMAEAGAKYAGELTRKTLLHGIGDHNFETDSGEKAAVDDNLVNALMEGGEVVAEIERAIQEWNRPFVRKTEQSSEMQSPGPA